MKLKIKNLNRLIGKLSGREIDLLLYLVKRQSDIGCVDGVYYQDAMDSLHMPKSTFYYVLQELQLKDFIYLRDLDTGCGFNIFIFDNSFLTEGDFKEGYININLDFILSERFILLHVKLKKFFLRLLGLQANTKSVRLLKDTLRQYRVLNLMSELSEMFEIEIIDGGYSFKIRQELLKKSHNQSYLKFKQKIVSYCYIFKIDYTLQELNDTIRTITNQMRKNRLVLIHKAFDSIRDIGRLQPKLISHICGSKA